MTPNLRDSWLVCLACTLCTMANFWITNLGYHLYGLLIAPIAIGVYLSHLTFFLAWIILRTRMTVWHLIPIGLCFYLGFDFLRNSGFVTGEGEMAMLLLIFIGVSVWGGLACCLLRALSTFRLCWKHCEGTRNFSVRDLLILTIFTACTFGMTRFTMSSINWGISQSNQWLAVIYGYPLLFICLLSLSLWVVLPRSATAWGGLFMLVFITNYLISTEYANRSTIWLYLPILWVHLSSAVGIFTILRVAGLHLTAQSNSQYN